MEKVRIMPIRILIVDSYSLVREGLRMFLVHDLDFEIVGGSR